MSTSLPNAPPKVATTSEKSKSSDEEEENTDLPSLDRITFDDLVATVKDGAPTIESICGKDPYARTTGVTVDWLRQLCGKLKVRGYKGLKKTHILELLARKKLGLTEPSASTLDEALGGSSTASWTGHKRKRETMENDTGKENLASEAAGLLYRSQARSTATDRAITVWRELERLKLQLQGLEQPDEPSAVALKAWIAQLSEIHSDAVREARAPNPTTTGSTREAPSPLDTSKMAEYSVNCHCGRVKGRFRCSSSEVLAWDCSCSDCYRRRNVHVIIPKDDFSLDMGSIPLEDETILYQWGTKTAIRRFCKTCGVLPWYHPRSNPDGVAVTVNCVDWGTNGPNIRVESFDGINWERSYAEMNDESRGNRTISSQSSQKTDPPK